MGNCWAYIPSYVFKLTSGKELKADKDFVEGRVTEVRILKTRSGFNNSRLKFILAAKSGFSNAHTMVDWAKDQKGLLSGSGQSGFTFEGSDEKFKLKGFEKLYKTNEEFKDAFDNMVQGRLAEGVNERYSDISEDSPEVDIDEEFDDE